MFNLLKKVACPTLIIVLAILSFPLITSAKGVEPEEKVYFYLEDHLGSVDVILDEDGNITKRQDYLPFGKERLTAPEASTHQEDYGFTGKELDEETDLMYYGARYYDPNIGRFASLDPLVLGESSKAFSYALANPQELNGYTYVMNNPLKYVDPTGEWGRDVHYDLTYTLGLVAGLSESISRIIAHYDQDTDDNSYTSPGAYSFKGKIKGAENYIKGVTNNYHFKDKSEAVKDLKQATQNKDAVAFGTGLHSFQDTYSHGKFGTSWYSPSFHLANGQKPDKTYLNLERANKMAKDTFYQLRSFKLATNGLGDMTLESYNSQSTDLWNKISDSINDYNSSINKLGSSINSSADTSQLKKNSEDDKGN